MKKHLLTAFLISAFVACAAALPQVNSGKAWKTPRKSENTSVKNVMPVFADGNIIVCGNKSLTFTPDGKINITLDGKQLAQILNYYTIKNSETGKVNWQSHSARLSEIKREGNKIIWLLTKEMPDRKWLSAVQTLEIMPDGLLKLTAKLNAPPPQYKFNSRYQSFWVTLPMQQSEGSRVKLNGKSYTLEMNKVKIPGDWKSKKFKFDLHADDPECSFSVSAAKPEMYAAAFSALKSSRLYRATLEFGRENPLEGVIYIDLRKSPEKKAGSASRGGIDFFSLDQLEMPELRKNLLPNSSFEQGIAGYRIKHANRDRQWNWEPFQIVKKDAFHGRYALEMHARNIPDFDVRRLQYGVNLTTMAIPCTPGRYTLSFTAKSSEKSGSRLNFWIPCFTSGSAYAYFSKEGQRTFHLNDTYKRYSATFTVSHMMPVEIHFNVYTVSKSDAKVTIDAIQLERGSEMTAYDAKETEGRLLTSANDNFISAKEKINGRIEVISRQRGKSGTAHVIVKNFFGEKVFDRKIKFKTDNSGYALIAPDFDTIQGKGIFAVKVVYDFGDGVKNYEFHRYAKVDFLEGRHRLKRLFSIDYSTPESAFNFFRKLDRFRKLGIGAKGHHYNFDKAVWDAELAYGIEPLNAFTMSFIQDKNRKRIGFGIADTSSRESLKADDPRLLVRDYKLDSNGEITDAYLARLKQAAKIIASKHRHVKIWNFGGEVSALFPYDWWSKEGSLDKFALNYAKIMKAFSEGVREGSPKALVTQEDPCNMNPDGGIAEIDRFLYHSNKLGAKYDVISIHPYRYSPESPDLEADTGKLFRVLDKHGYGKTPVSWPEMMHWGPYTIPAWGTDFARWVANPSAWPGGVLSYDIGQTERLSAAYYARSFLVALRHSKRIVTATMGCMRNNFALDAMLTPYSASLIPNTLSNILGNSDFVEDIRFAPYMRSYVFVDDKNHPVAAVWCHLPGVDDGRNDAPVIEADFGDTLHSVLDIMNSKRSFTPGKFRFAVSKFPIFLKGRPGTLKAMLKAMHNATVVSGEGISPLGTELFFAGKNQVKIDITNFLSSRFSGKINSRTLDIPPNGKTSVVFDAPGISDSKITSANFNYTISGNKNKYQYATELYGFTVHRVADGIDLNTVDFRKLPAIPIPAKEKNTKTSGEFRMAWNSTTLFLEVRVRDKTFCHTEYPKAAARWKNDCVQFYIDTLADGRNKKAVSFDENDYSYAIFPNANGRGARFYRYRSVDGQLSLGVSTPQNNTFADDIPADFRIEGSTHIYRTAVPAKYLLPLKLEKHRSFGFALYVPDSNKRAQLSGSLTTSKDGKAPDRRPATFPHALLVE